MTRTAKQSRSRSYSDPVTALGLLLLGAVTLCLAVLYPVRLLMSDASAAEMVSGTLLVLPADTFVVVAGLLVVSASATTLGVLILFLRL